MGKVKKIDIARIIKGERVETLDSVVIEKPISIYINYQFYTALMCTPFETVELALGFLYSEGIIETIDSIESIEEKYGDRVCVILKEEIKIDFEAPRVISSGCCKGSIGLKNFEEENIRIIESNSRFSSSQITEFMKEFNCKSELFKETGGVHSSAICSNDGIILYSEDIGRHNALDKVLGKALMNRINLEDTMIMTTGRISSDMVIKALRAGIAIIVSHSAPTSLAIEFAEALNAAIVGFVRGNRMNIYCGEERIYID